MSLITIFFPCENEFGYAKAIIRKEDKDFFKSLATVYDTPDDIPPKDEFNLGLEINDIPLGLDLDHASIETTDKPIFASDNEPELETDPNAGYGAINSFKWHTTQVKAMESKQEVVDYVKNVTGKEISKRGSLLSVKLTAIDTIEEFMDNGNQSK